VINVQSCQNNPQLPHLCPDDLGAYKNGFSGGGFFLKCIHPSCLTPCGSLSLSSPGSSGCEIGLLHDEEGGGGGGGVYTARGFCTSGFLPEATYKRRPTDYYRLFVGYNPVTVQFLLS
jgi:hypothetical protein